MKNWFMNRQLKSNGTIFMSTNRGWTVASKTKKNLMIKLTKRATMFTWDSSIRKMLCFLFLLVCSQTTITSKDDSKRKSCKRGNAEDCAQTTSKDDREINSCERGGGGGEECGTTRNLFLSTTPLPTATTPDFRSEVLRVLIFQNQNFLLETAICQREVHVWPLRFIPF